VFRSFFLLPRLLAKSRFGVPGVKFRECHSTSRLFKVSIYWCSQIMDLGVPAQEINSRAYLLVLRHGLAAPVVCRHRTTVQRASVQNDGRTYNGIVGTERRFNGRRYRTTDGRFNGRRYRTTVQRASVQNDGRTVQRASVQNDGSTGVGTERRTDGRTTGLLAAVVRSSG
jgi:hypothetical protein